jgi:hypothetical protein
MPTSRDVAEIGLKLIVVYFVMQGLAMIAPIAATLGTMPSIPPGPQNLSAGRWSRWGRM